MSRSVDNLQMQPLYGVSHYLLRQFYQMFFRGEVVGLDNVPEDGSFLIASNHASHLDPPFVGCQIGVQMAFFARKTLWKPGIASWWLDRVGTIPVDRDGGSDVTAIKRVLQSLKAHRPVILFPEGTRTPDGNLQTPKPGVGLLACRTQVPVVPARVFGSYEAFGKEGKLRLGTPVNVVFGSPLQPKEYDHPSDGKERYQRASERIMDAIAKLPAPRPIVL